MVRNFGNVPSGSQQPVRLGRESDDDHHHDELEDGLAVLPAAPAVGSSASHDPDNMVGLFLDLGHLKTGLQAWRDQVKAMIAFSDEFAAMEDWEPGDDAGPGAAGGGAGANKIDPHDFLQRVVDDYNVMIAKAGMVMEGTSLAYQMVRTLLQLVPLYSFVLFLAFCLYFCFVACLFFFFSSFDLVMLFKLFSPTG